ncbi:MAG: FKBP-type peptidyl-prolyl cis-trans isomerase [Treponema sp.]|jgi:FKBP-type peptidyl-prolyl cis-trans isomerase|nr:FKBP-type peptidyl-prolyl cis-trans isomerase [Treponema sp.]
MKKLIILTALMLFALSLHARGIQEDYKKSEEKARVSYAFGMILGSNLQSTPLEFDYIAFAEGMKAIMENGETQFTEQEAMEIVETAMQKAMDKKADEYRVKEEEFLANNITRPEVQVSETGLQYEILAETEGEKPVITSIVRVNYTGAFMDGSQFDQSNDEDGGAYIPLGMVIPGWAEGLLLMSPGSKYKFYIPSSLAYGKEGAQPMIAPYSTLIFEVELLEIINEVYQESDDAEEESEDEESSEEDS